MKSQRTTELKVGIVFLTAVILLLVGIILGKGFQVTSSQVTISLRFPNSGGLQPSSPIVVNGVKRGTVGSVINDNGSVLITATIDDISDFKKDVSAKVTILELTGGKKIEINPGTSHEHYDLKNEIPGTTPADIPELVAILGSVSGDAIMLIKRLDTIATAGTRMLDDKQMLRDLKSIIINTSEATANLNELLRNNRSDLDITFKNLKIITSDLKLAINKDEPKLDSLLTNLNDITNSAKKLFVKVDSLMISADGTLADLKDITGEIKGGKGTISKLIYDKEFSEKLNSTLDSLSQFVNQIKQYGININARLGTRP
jgi:phospholipid/cholesterol/gamma-HCH transport system substrate-binding protein